MVRRFGLAALRHATAPATRIRTTIAITTRNIQTIHILLLQIRRPMLRTRQSMTALETAIAAIPMRAPRAMPETLGLHTALTTAQDPPLPALVVALDRLRLQAPHPDQGPPALPLPVLLLRVHIPLRTQRIAHGPDRAPGRRLHLRPRHLPRRRIPAEAVGRHNK